MQKTDLKGYPLSQQQARLWALQEENPVGEASSPLQFGVSTGTMPICSGELASAYYVQCMVLLQGPLDLAALFNALQSMVERHDILRTTFQHLSGMDVPIQVVTRHIDVNCPVVDLEHLSADHQTAQLNESLMSLQHEVTHQENHPHFFTELLRLSAKKHLLLISIPALCADGYTLTQIVSELSQTYDSHLRGSNQDDEPLQYADVAAWQDELLHSEEAEALHQYWRKIDLSRLETQYLPFERLLLAIGSGSAQGTSQRRPAPFNPFMIEIPLEESVSAQVSRLAQHSGVSLDAWLLACWDVVLWRCRGHWTYPDGKRDHVIGVACDGRVYEELTSAVGLYTRFVPIETYLEDDLPFDLLVTSVHEAFLAAIKQQIYFTWQVEGTSATGFFPICFEFERWPALFVAGELNLSLYRRFCCTERFVLKLSVLQVGEHLYLEVYADPQKMDSGQVRQLARILHTLIRGAVERPQVPVSMLPLLEPDEQVSLLTMGCGPRQERKQAPSLHHLFEEQVRRQPNQLAVICSGVACPAFKEQLTYQQLNERTNRLARVLRKRGVGPNVLVGLCMARGAQALVGLLGILKAGGAYMPLDPGSPPARIAHQLQESRTLLLLTQQEVYIALPEWRGGSTLCLEDLEQELSEALASDLTEGSEEEDLAYVIYTSGSTGVPKGVMIRQSSVVNYTLSLCELLRAEPGWQYATVSTLAADLGNTAIFCALVSGGCVQVLDAEMVIDASAMVKWAEQHPIDVLKIVPSHLSALLVSEDAQKLIPRQALVLGGEALPVSLLERLEELGGGCKVFNHYGPTETTIGVLVNEVGTLRGLSGWEEMRPHPLWEYPPLGKPITNTEVYVLDSRMQVVPIGVTGELYIGGAGLAMGYVGQVEQTAERFVPHPFVGTGARLYRTGDLARYDKDGKIEFVGRGDGQVKLRGYRIELAEIEAVLRQHPQVRNSVVMLREDVPSAAGPCLVAYVVARRLQSLTTEQLHNFLRQFLPEYMIPAVCVQVDAFPLTTNGKVDRQKLPVPVGAGLVSARPEREQTALALPRGPIEEMLVEIWRNLLRVSVVGIHDNFFALGGHSLLATRVMAQVQAVFQITLPVQMLFDAPTVAGLAQRIDQAVREGQGIPIPSLRAMTRPEGIPLSFAQQRLWFLDQLEEGGTAYLSPHAMRLQGQLNAQALEQSLKALVYRHESLRTTFELRMGQPIQVIHPPTHTRRETDRGKPLSVSCPVLPIIDLQGLSSKSQEEEARWLTQKEAQSPMNLARGPLLRMSLLRISKQEHVLLLTLHHIITDGWSNQVFVRELTTLYRARVSGPGSGQAQGTVPTLLGSGQAQGTVPTLLGSGQAQGTVPPLPDLPIQYADYALWQREWLQGEVLAAQLTYWRKQLANVSPLELPTDYPRPAVQTHRGARQERRLPEVLSLGLMTLSGTEHVTLFMLLLAAFQVLLARYSGNRDIAVGTPIANRNHAHTETLIGFFVNTLVLRTNLSGNPTFREILKQVRQVALEAYAHQDIPFEQVVDALQPERDLSRSPLFQVLFVWQNAPQDQEALAGMSVKPLVVENTVSKFDLTLLANATARRELRLVVEYNTDLFEAETIRRMLSHFQTLLEGIVQDSQAGIWDLLLLTETERNLLLVEWNATETGEVTPPLQDLCVHQLFEQQVERTPDAVALVFEDEVLTYRELNRRANQLAHHLQDLGVVPEVLVGICMERSIEMVVGVLSVLKAGGAYVPLDPELPASRLAFLLQDARISVLLTQPELSSHVPTDQARIVLLRQVWEKLLSEPDHNPTSTVSSQNLAYIIYTSGSTGTPKGVQVTHEGLSNLGQAQADTFAIGSGNRVLQFASLNFDASVWEILMALLAGASLHVDQAVRMLPGPDLWQVLREQAITCVTLPPSILALLPTSDLLPALQTLVVAGEACPVGLMVHWAQGRSFFNAYGPTEATVCASIAACSGEQEPRPTLSLGRPLVNTQMYLLDQGLQLVPVGMPGEICLGGRGLARGYLSRPDLTAERFIPHPFAGARTGAVGIVPCADPVPTGLMGERLYRTGDLARRLPDGTIEFLGRIDQQVKLRGYRLELGEVETVLAQHESVQGAIVVMREDKSRDKHLVAYVMTEGSHKLSTGELRRYLQDHLPAYMIPSAFVLLEAFPLTANGKLDRRALPAPEPSQDDLGRELEEAKTPMEELLGGLWCEVLGRRQVGLDENFFELGGHSLLLTRLVAQIRAVLKVEVPLRAVFEAPTVAVLAQRIEQIMRESQGIVLPPLVPAARASVIPLSFAQQRLWFLDQLKPQSTAYLLPHAYHFSGILNSKALEKSFAQLVQRHEILRTTFEVRAGHPVQVIHPIEGRERHVGTGVSFSPDASTYELSGLTSHVLSGQRRPLSVLTCPVIDLQALRQEKREEVTHWLTRQEAQHPMCLSTGPLLRTSLLRLDVQEHVLLLTLHHIITDGWSNQVLVRELTTLYQAGADRDFLSPKVREGQPKPLSLRESESLPPLPVQYADYAIWQRAWLSGEVLEEQMAYWRKQLAGVSPLELPTNHPRPTMQTHRGAVQSLRLPEDLSEGLQHLCREENVTLFMLLLSTFQVLLARYTGSRDISIGTPIANRRQAEAEGVIGFFVNTLVLRTDLSGDPPFVEVLKRVREVCLGAYAHQDIPFEKVVEELEPERDLSRSPLFQVMFVLHNARVETVREDLTRVSVKELAGESTTSKFDLTLSVEEMEQGLGCQMKYATDLLEANTITRMLTHFQTLLEGIVQNRYLPVSELPLLMEGEREQILVEWNKTLEDYPQDICVHQLFEQQVKRTPDAIAVVDAKTCLTYEVLNQRANHLAHRLQQLGIGPEGIVGVCMQRSHELLIALLAIFKAGGTYLPLDPTYPVDRLASFLEGGQPIVILCDTSVVMTLQSKTGVPLLCIDRRDSALSPLGDGDTANLSRAEVTPENLAYIIYTSGSTGKPKGVMIHHRGMVNHLYAKIADLSLSWQDRIAQTASLSFDISLWQLLTALLVGGSTVIYSQEVVTEPTKLMERLQVDQISIVEVVPSHLRALLQTVADQSQEQRSLRLLRWLIVTGEAFPPELCRQWQACYPEIPLINAYGPTECSDDVTHFPLREVLAQGTGPAVPGLFSVPIGRPVNNLRLYVLGASLELVPIGATGELYVGGIGVGRGYLHDPCQTAVTFVPNPFVGTGPCLCPGERLYKTGDLARYRVDGTLEYLGRTNQQVKLRGYRIELGEIETVLGHHPAVSQCVVVLRETSPEDRQLVAYVVIAEKAQSFSTQEGYDYLGDLLPLFMIPTQFVFLERLPLTSVGKVDRRALLALAAPQLQQTKIDQAPSTLLEKQLACMWEEMLHVQRVGRNDSFFALGGHSILAAIFMNKLQARLGVFLHVATLFNAPTVSGLADYLAKRHRAAVERVFGAGVHMYPEMDDRSRHPLTATHVAQLRGLILSLSPLSSEHRRSTKNPPAVFLLSPPRSGSTLLRVMLAGHPQFFAPPELELLSFNTLRERAETYQGSNSFWLEGTVRALMELHRWDAQTAQAFMADCEQQDLTTQDFYALMQRQLGERLLVDKTPAYALDRAILERAEATFEQARYIYLVRHPYGMMHSFEEASLDQVFFRYPHAFATRELAELIWLVSHQNIQEFLQTIPADRQYQVRFEDLVQKPVEVMEKLAAFLHIEFHPNLLEPYSGQRMTDGIIAASKMLGDVKFHQHKTIDAAVADRWKSVYTKDVLGEMTWQMAEALGYQRTVSGGEAEEASILSSHDELLQIPHLSRGGQQAFPLSFAQQRLWFLDQLEPGGTAYLSPHAMRLEGQLNARALEQSLQVLVDRHESLRTTFEQRMGQPIQIIHPPTPSYPVLPIIDLQGLGSEKREEEARWLAKQEAQSPMSLARGPLLRPSLLRLSMQEHTLLLTLHHIITDGWSHGVLVRELRTLYQACVSGQPSPLMPLPIQYADYALWQREWLQGEVLAAQLTYWRKQLAGAPALLELPTDRPRPAVQTHGGARQVRILAPELLQQLKSLSQREGVTLFMTLLATFQVLLMRYSGKTDIVVGSPIAHRTRTELEHLIGFFLNTVVLRTDLSGNPSFQQLLVRVREVASQAYMHQDIPFEKLVEETHVERSLSHSPIFQVLFILQNTPRSDATLTGLTIRQQEAEHSTTWYDLSLVITEGEQGLLTEVVYRTDLFHEATMTCLLSHLQILLEAVVHNPEQTLATLPLLTEREQQLIACGLAPQVGPTVNLIPTDLCMHQLFAQQVEQTPDAIALTFEQQQISYHELNAGANHLAYCLRAEGIGPESLVGVFLQRSPWMLISILAVFKVGGAYVPLDPSYPEQRLHTLIQESHLHLILTEASVWARFSQASVLGTEEVSLLMVERMWERTEPASSQPVPTQNSVEHLACVIYTSGSTGLPKGAMVTQRGMINHLFAKVDTLQLQPTDTIAQTAAASFVISVWQSLAALLVGGRVCILPDEIAHDPGWLFGEVSKQGITVLELVPSLLQAALDTLENRMALSLHWMVVTGEACPMGLVERWGQSYPQIPLVNAYGLTECSDDVTQAVLIPTTDTQTQTAPIGSPLANTQIYLLDEQMRPVPIGVPGEIYVGGPGVGRGYLYDPVRTALAFVPHPFVDLPARTGAVGIVPCADPVPTGVGERLYRTGDMARYLGNGQIEFIGRKDQQVKIRGFRIELGEIEATLLRHVAVREAVVLAHEDKRLLPATSSLVAYVVAEAGRASTLRSYLQEHLPAYMIPAFIVSLDALPHTPNGKVDRKALPLPQLEEEPEGEAEVRTPIEELIAGLYGLILGCPQVGRHDNFFELGGHSLLATRLVARIRTVLKVEVPLRVIFETPTVAVLAQRIEQIMRESQGVQLLPLVPVARPEEIPLSFAQQRLWFLDQLEPESTAYLVPTAMRLQGQLIAQALEQSLKALVSRHESLRTTFEPRTRRDSGLPLFAYSCPAVQIIHVVGTRRDSGLLLSGLCPVLPIIDLQGLSSERREGEARRLIKQEAQCPMRLTRGPLLRTSLMRLQEQEHVLLLTLHHMITDGWSNRVLVHELTTLYKAHLSDAPSPLTPLPIQYADYALWQQQWLRGEVLEGQLAYWKKQLAGITPITLPLDRPRPPRVSHRGAIHPFALSTSLTQALVRLSAEAQTTLFMTLLSAFQTLLHRYCGQDDIVVGTDIANRQRVETEGLIGFFVNQLVLRANLSGNPTFREVLMQVRATTLQAYTHQDLPFEKLVESLQPKRSLQYSPLFQVKFLLDKMFDQPFSHVGAGQGRRDSGLPLSAPTLEGITVNRETPFPSSSQVDLLLRMSEAHEGLVGTFTYNADVFDEATIVRMAQHFVKLLECMSTTPDAHLDTFELTTEEERMQKKMQQGKNTDAFRQFNLVSPKPVSLEQEQLIRTSYLSTQEPLPLVIRPQRKDLDLVEWAKHNQTFIEAELRKHGALLFRDFQLASPAEFEQFTLALCSDLFAENSEHVPAGVGTGHLYTPVFYAPEKKLLWHNENSFNAIWPMKIWFFCAQPASKGGETPIADNRQVLESIDPQIREHFMQKGVMYIRNYSEGLGLPWQKVFRTEKKEEVERACRKAGIDFEWKGEGQLKTRMVRPAVLKHPQTGEWVWWNQATHWHPACLDKEVRAALGVLMAEQDWPRNCCYGDGSPIEDAVMDVVCATYQEAEVSFPWQQGDVLMLDNMLTAHARNPYAGPRKIYVSMGNMSSLNDYSHQ